MPARSDLRTRIAAVAKKEAAQHHIWTDPECAAERFLRPLRDELGGARGYYAWCGAFVRWCWLEAGVQDLPDQFPTGYTPAYVPGWLKWARAQKRYHDVEDSYAPQPGDAVIFEWMDGDADPDHIGIFLRFTGRPKEIVVAEGNTTSFIDGMKVRNVSDVMTRGPIVIKGFVRAIP